MIVICEECAKKYDIDETKIKLDKAYFSCRKCHHQIIVHKPQEKTIIMDEGFGLPKSEDRKRSATHLPKETHIQDKKKQKQSNGIPLAIYFFLPVLTGFLIVNGVLAYFFINNIPGLFYKQAGQRAESIATVFISHVKEQLLESDYRTVAKEAEKVAALPGVAYVTYINNNNAAVVGVFGELNRFSLNFNPETDNNTFPISVLGSNRLAGSNEKETMALLSMGGQKVFDSGLAVSEAGGELHIGIMVGKFDKILYNLLLSPVFLGINVVIWLCGLLTFVILARYVSKPLKELTDIVHRISLGELDLIIDAKGPKEIREFSRSFERMRFSIREAINRLKM